MQGFTQNILLIIIDFIEIKGCYRSFYCDAALWLLYIYPGSIAEFGSMTNRYFTFVTHSCVELEMPEWACTVDATFLDQKNQHSNCASSPFTLPQLHQSQTAAFTESTRGRLQEGQKCLHFAAPAHCVNSNWQASPRPTVFRCTTLHTHKHAHRKPTLRSNFMSLRAAWVAWFYSRRKSISKPCMSTREPALQLQAVGVNNSPR